ncbi:MAG: hypothetical protein ACRD26_23545 [Vicinamibacterales bacterium]
MIGLLAGFLLGLILPRAWRIARALRDARRRDGLDMQSRERRQMLTKAGEL